VALLQQNKHAVHQNKNLNLIEKVEDGYNPYSYFNERSSNKGGLLQMDLQHRPYSTYIHSNTRNHTSQGSISMKQNRGEGHCLNRLLNFHSDNCFSMGPEWLYQYFYGNPWMATNRFVLMEKHCKANFDASAGGTAPFSPTLFIWQLVEIADLQAHTTSCNAKWACVTSVF